MEFIGDIIDLTGLGTAHLVPAFLLAAGLFVIMITGVGARMLMLLEDLQESLRPLTRDQRTGGCDDPVPSVPLGETGPAATGGSAGYVTFSRSLDLHGCDSNAGAEFPAPARAPRYRTAGAPDSEMS